MVTGNVRDARKKITQQMKFARIVERLDMRIKANDPHPQAIR